MANIQQLPIPPDEWLFALNREFRNQNIDVRKRPFLALDRYSSEFHVPAVPLESPPAARIFTWFSEAAKPGAHQIGAIFTGAYYYDTSFWAIDVPHMYGLRVNLDSASCLRNIPHETVESLMSTPKSAWEYTLAWADCVDFAYGFDDLEKRKNLDLFGLQLLRSGMQQLQAAVSQLLERVPNATAAMSSRMSIEMMLKSFLALQGRLDEAGARTLSHNLVKAIAQCRDADPNHPILSIEAGLHVLPDVNDRYAGTAESKANLWEAYRLAQFTAAALVRSFTTRNVRLQMLARNQGN